jgi:hypothetical protein
MSSYNRSTTYRALLTFVAATTSFGCYIADWNETHIYNPRWPPHAKFHNGQTMSMGFLLGAATMYYLWRPVRAESAKDNLQIVTIFANLYWITQLSAILYPGTLLMDPEFGETHFQYYLDCTMFALSGIGYMLESRNISESTKVAKT